MVNKIQKAVENWAFKVVTPALLMITLRVSAVENDIKKIFSQ